MKTKIKRHSRSVISVILAVCMLVSCMTVGLIATDAARFDSDSVGYGAVYVHFRDTSGNDLTNGKVSGGTGDTGSATFSIPSAYQGQGMYVCIEATYDGNAHWYGTSNSNSSQNYIANGTSNWNVYTGFSNSYGVYYKVGSGAISVTIAYNLGGTDKKITSVTETYDPACTGLAIETTDNSLESLSDTFDLTATTTNAKTGVTYTFYKGNGEEIGHVDSDNGTATLSGLTQTDKSSQTYYVVATKSGCSTQTSSTITITNNAVSNEKTIYVGVVSFIVNEAFSGDTSSLIDKLKVHYWNADNQDVGDATNPTYMGTQQHTVSSGWNDPQTFHMYRFTIPADRSYMHAWLDLNTDRWFGQDSTTEYNTIYIYNYGTSNADKADYVNETYAQSTLSINDISGATVRATYNGTTIDEGGSISDIPAGAQVTISVTPEATGKKCTAVTATPAGATITGSGRTFTLTMPAEDTTITGVTLDNAQNKKVYFNNYYSRYSMVTAYAWYGTPDQSRIDGEPLGAWSGQTMTRIANTNTWEIEVPEDCPYIIFVGAGGNNTNSNETVGSVPYYHITIPWDDRTYPMYTAGKDKTNPTSGGKWGNYVARDNETTVTDGDTLSNNSNLFHGISATMYDYYVDSEHTNGWLNISDPEYSKSDAAFTVNPYTIFNDALDGYAREFGVDYPLYFGDFFGANDDGNSDVTKVKHGSNTGEIYKNWNKLINNSSGLSDTETKKNAVTGLSGKTLADSDIHYYESSAANENGARMAMFDEDFLSGQNNQGTKLAQILRVSSFPIRTTSKDTYTHVYFDASGIRNWYAQDSNSIYAYFWNGSVSTKVAGTKTGDVFAFKIPEGYENGKMLFYRSNGINGSWNNLSDDFDVPENSSVMFSATGTTNKSSKDYFTGNWGTYNNASVNKHPYYEYDSTGGKDNAYIQNISSDGKTAVINYYSESDNNKVYAAKSGSGTAALGAAGFFPFDNNGTINQVGQTAHDLGFGMKLEIPFTLEANGQFEDGTHQVFDFSGDDDLWVFVDGKLVLDLGGDHNATTGKIDFADKTATADNSQALGSADRNGTFEFDNSNPNTVHTMTLYYMERGMWDSNLKFGFSFHAIPNQLKTEKKVRTANINSGFYHPNNQSGDASNESATLTAKEGRFIGKFEETYQNEDFIITHEYKSASASEYSTAAGKEYTIGSSATKTVGSDGTYKLKNDEIAYFLKQFTSGDSIRLKESPDETNLYNYDMSATVYDDANNEAVVTSATDAGTPFTFDFVPTSQQTIETLNLRARFTNQMKSHNLSVSKTATGGSDNDEFTFRIKFKFGDYDYIAYPITGSKTGTGIDTKENVTVAGDGTFTLKNGQTVLFEKIPENAKIQIEEINIDPTYNYNGLTVSVANKTNITDGVQFTMGTTDITANASNSKFSGFTVSKELKYSPSDGVFVDYPDSTTAFNIKIESSSDGNTWTALGSKAFTSSDSSRTGTLATDANGLTTIKRGEKLSFADIAAPTYIRVTEDTADSTQEGNYLNHMPLDYQYKDMVAANNVNTTKYGNAGGWQGISFQVSSARVDVTITNMKPRYTYLAKYSFASRKKNVTKKTDESIFGDLDYHAGDVFTAQDLYDYTQFAMQTNYGGGSAKGIEFKSDDAKEEFFTKRTAPFDDNFRQTVSWEIKEAVVEYHFGSSTSACQLVISPQAAYSDLLRVSVNFYLPCATKTNDAQDELIMDPEYYQDGLPKAKLNNGYPIANNDHIYTMLPKNTIKFADWYATNDASVHNEKTPKFVTAPLIVYDVDAQTQKYFQYWSIKTMENDSQNSIEYARCYSNELNYVFFQDSNAYAVYGDSQATGYENARTIQGNQANLIFLENSRNQWNQTAENTPYTKKDWGDRVFSDFVLDFHYVTKDNQNLLLQTIPENERANYKAGLLIETVRDLDSTEVDKTKKMMLKTDKEIANGYRTVDNMAAQNAAMDALIEKYKNNTALDSKYLDSAISVAKLDNKNELEYAYSFANISQSASSEYRTETTRKDKLYRAYAYLIHIGGSEDGEDVKMISAPVYFTIYDMASIVNDYDVKVTK